LGWHSHTAQNFETYLKNYQSKEGWGHGSSSRIACLARRMPWVRPTSKIIIMIIRQSGSIFCFIYVLTTPSLFPPTPSSAGVWTQGFTLGR
jgi:hypothetical protein